MNESNLTQLLERTADRTAVSAPPLAALHTGARRRRRRMLGACGTAVVVAAAVVIGVGVQLGSRASVAPAAPPTRLVGFGHAAIAVPADWPTNRSMCGTPQQDTVQIDDPSAARCCFAYRRSGLESVAVHNDPPSTEFQADETFIIDGVRAERQRGVCLVAQPQSSVRTCTGTVVIRSMGVWFRAESSTGAAEVDRLLASIRIVKDQAGVPGYQVLDLKAPKLESQAYAAELLALGLKAKYESRKSPGYPRGTILGVSPAPGTMLRPGSTVTMTVAG
ncbi:hypothetical protein GCM10009804_20600 [Kribbella hippodromi]|uniref:PASTA domain-containing protein n=1 Tax=Kribbella hippodromi TaxID=434347 RepID=A0ABN2CWZ0_9ACTN